MNLTDNRLKNQFKTKQPKTAIGSGILLGFCCSLLGTQSAEAASFSFTKIADNNSSLFSGYDDWNGAINDKGTVAFYAGSGSEDGGIFTGNGKKISTVVNLDILTQQLYPNPYPPQFPPGSYQILRLVDINDQDTVAFSGMASFLGGYDSRQGIFIADNKKIKTVIDLGRIPLTSRGVFSFDLNNQNSLTTLMYTSGAFIAPTFTITLYNNITESNPSSTFVAEGSWDNYSTGGRINVDSQTLNNQGTVLFSSLFKNISDDYPLPPFVNQLIIQQGDSQTLVTNKLIFISCN